MNFSSIQSLDSANFPMFTCLLKAGFPSPADDYIESEIDLNRYLIHNKEATFMARVEGNSMMDTLCDGDLLVIDRSLQAKHDDIVVAVLDGDFTIKRLLKEGNRIILFPDNVAYNPIELKEGMNFLVWGVVTYSIKQV